MTTGTGSMLPTNKLTKRPDYDLNCVLPTLISRPGLRMTIFLVTLICPRKSAAHRSKQKKKRSMHPGGPRRQSGATHALPLHEAKNQQTVSAINSLKQ